MDDAIYEVFAPLAQGAPGDEASTLAALAAVPGRDGCRDVLDLGAGRGRTTFTLARALPEARITAVEIHAPFAGEIAAGILETGLGGRVHAVCGDMEAIDIAESSLDLVWAEGSIYLTGRERALARWRPWLRPGGCVAFSDLAWWTASPSPECRGFWTLEYPDMASETVIHRGAREAGYRVMRSFRMSRNAHDAYYLPFRARVDELAGSSDAGILAILGDLRREIDVAGRFPHEAGYTFFVLQRDDRRTGPGR